MSEVPQAAVTGPRIISSRTSPPSSLLSLLSSSASSLTFHRSALVSFCRFLDHSHFPVLAQVLVRYRWHWTSTEWLGDCWLLDGKECRFLPSSTTAIWCYVWERKVYCTDPPHPYYCTSYISLLSLSILFPSSASCHHSYSFFAPLSAFSDLSLSFFLTILFYVCVNMSLTLCKLGPLILTRISHLVPIRSDLPFPPFSSSRSFLYFTFPSAVRR